MIEIRGIVQLTKEEMLSLLGKLKDSGEYYIYDDIALNSAKVVKGDYDKLVYIKMKSDVFMSKTYYSYGRLLICLEED